MIIKCKDEEFVNKFGRTERYVSKEIIKSLTGHVNRGSAFSTDSSCGNCDGARCEWCSERFEVSHYDIPTINEEWGYEEDVLIERKVFWNKEEALEYYESI